MTVADVLRATGAGLRSRASFAAHLAEWLVDAATEYTSGPRD